MVRCHWMSHCTPQPATILEAIRLQSTARRVASSISTGLAIDTVVAGLETLIGGIVASPVSGPGGHRRAAVEDPDLVVRHGQGDPGLPEVLDQRAVERALGVAHVR